MGTEEWTPENVLERILESYSREMRFMGGGELLGDACCAAIEALA